MKFPSFLFFTVGLVLACLPLSAKPVTFSPFSGHLTVPDDWTVSPLAGGTGNFAASVSNADHSESISIFICPTTSKPPLTEESEYVKGFLKSGEDHHATITNKRHEKLNGMDFYVMSITQKLPAAELEMMVWITLSNGHIYQVSCYQKNSDPAKNPHYTSILGSLSTSSG